eukprot:m.174105 g.174105  ORF g.174105 m.174105 type:complete len:346 (+) comp13790_c0_seq1:272-1309(+)
MGERKVLNKYYPPDFDPSKVPRRRMAKDRQYKVRLMAPFNMRCVHCGDYIYKGKKFDAQKETVLGEDYLGIRIFRFYIRCPRCASAITFKTDPKTTDYVCETGATRNFENWRVVDDAEDAGAAQEEEDEQNPMAALERRTEESKREIDILDALEELKDANEARFNLDIDQVIAAKADVKAQLLAERQAKREAEDDAVVAAAFGGAKVIRRIESSDEDEDDGGGGGGGVGGTAAGAAGAASSRPTAKRARREGGLPSKPKTQGLHLGSTVLRKDMLIRPKKPAGLADGAAKDTTKAAPAATADNVAPTSVLATAGNASSSDESPEGDAGGSGLPGLGLNYSSSSDE